MAFAIYKPGQGYWTRVCTAIGVGVLVLSGVAWLWQQFSAIGTNTKVLVPYTQMTQSVNKLGGNNKVGMVGNVTLAGPDQVALTDRNTGKSITISRAGFAWALNDAQEELVTKGQLLQALGIGGSDINEVQSSENSVSVSVTTFAARNRIYFQTAMAVVLIAGMGLLTLWLLNYPRIVDFMIATEAEMRKVSWPTRRELMLSTVVVICGTAMMAVLLFFIDLFFAFVFSSINVLDRGL